MKVQIDRYSFEKEKLNSGSLIVENEGPEIILEYVDSEIKVVAKGLYHPLKALESLRIILEKEHQSFVNCMGCRLDSSYRPTGGYGSYLLEKKKQAVNRIQLFEPTTEISKLGTVAEHKAEYQDWCQYFRDEIEKRG